MSTDAPARDTTLPSCENFLSGSVCHRSTGGKNSANSYYSYNSWYGVFAAQGFMVLIGCNAWFSIASINGIFCVASINSVLSVGSVNSFLSIGCMNSFMKNCARSDPKSRRLREAGGQMICGEDFKEKDTVFSGDATFPSCKGGSLEGKYGIFASDLLTEVECLQGGGEWETHTCESIGNYLYESAEKDGVTEVMRASAIENFLAPACCQTTAVN
mmetsp:Transcript_12568/g.29690  ORF Transcript_12568/g.29690 Transcript_12568/m.29690 type:complete len:215 (-) Transcript_12568:180-824(-)